MGYLYDNMVFYFILDRWICMRMWLPISIIEWVIPLKFGGKRFVMKGSRKGPKSLGIQ